MLYSSREIQTLFQRARHTGGVGGGKDAFFQIKKSCVNVVTGVKVAHTVIVATNGMEFATKHDAESTAKSCIQMKFVFLSKAFFLRFVN